MAFAQCLIARNKERGAAISALVALAVNLGGCIIFVRVLHVAYQYVMLASVFSMIVFFFVLFAFLRKEIGLNLKMMSCLGNCWSPIWCFCQRPLLV